MSYKLEKIQCRGAGTPASETQVNTGKGRFLLHLKRFKKIHFFKGGRISHAQSESETELEPGVGDMIQEGLWDAAAQLPWWGLHHLSVPCIVNEQILEGNPSNQSAFP